MGLATGVADLHLHTTASDGTCTVGDRVSQAVERGLDAIAITDHDVVGDDLTAPVTDRDGVEVVTGVEIRADLFDTKIEILGYYVDPADDRLETTLSSARAFRRRRNERLVERLADVTPLDIDYGSMCETVDGELGRPHLAARLVEDGVVDSIGAAFDEYLGSGGAAYVPMERLSAETVIDAVHAAGGVTSLAHPGRIRSDRVDEMVPRLAELGLDGVEVWYPYDDAGPGAYADVGVPDAARLAADNGLLRTGGSDCHGPGSGKFRIGSVRVPADALGALRERATR
jgi:hypothetical protein